MAGDNSWGARGVGVLGGLFCLALLTSTGCDGSSDQDQPAQAGSSSGGQGGSAGVPAESSAGQGGSAGAPAESSAGQGGSAGMIAPALGSCRATRRLQGSSSNRALELLPTRLQDGFVYRESQPGSEFGWLVGTDRNEWRELQTSAPFSPRFNPVAAGSAEVPQWVLFTRTVTGTYDEELLAQAILADGSLVAPLASVLAIYARGTESNPTATALDGERVAFGNAHVATRDPHFILLDKDARPVSEEIALFETGDAPIFDCFTLTGTAHGVLASILDHDAQLLYLLELDASGARVNEATAPMPEGSACPAVSVDTTGNYLSFAAGLGTNEQGAVSVFQFASNALTLVATLPSSTEDVKYRWVAGGDQPLLAAVNSTDASVSFARLEQDEVVPLEGGPFQGQRVPSADGRVFLASDDRFEPSEPVDPETPTIHFTISEVVCH